MELWSILKGDIVSGGGAIRGFMVIDLGQVRISTSLVGREKFFDGK